MRIFCEYYSTWIYNALIEAYIRIATTETGWTDDAVCAKWFIENFIPQAKVHADPMKPVVLLFDGHNSHMSPEMLDAAHNNNIILFCLPPHTTHRLQPCDVGVFGPLKKYWFAGCEAYQQETGEQIGTKDTVMVYMAARRKAMETSTILQAWRKSGISIDDDGNCICNPEIFTESDFATSMMTSTHLQLPAGFPEWDTSESSALGQAELATIRFDKAALVNSCKKDNIESGNDSDSEVIDLDEEEDLHNCQSK
jgi:hypothetical protein